MKNVLWKRLPKIVLLMTISTGLFLIVSTSVFAAAPTFTGKINNVDNTDAYIVLTFSEAVYATNGATGALEVADFTPSGTDALTVSSAKHVAGSKYVILTMSGNVDSGAAGQVLVTCAAASVYNAGGDACVQVAYDVDAQGDAVAPVLGTKILQDADIDGKVDQVIFTYDEPVIAKGQVGGYDDAANWTVAAGGHTGLVEANVWVGRAYAGATGASDGNLIKYAFTEGSVQNTAVDSLTYTYTLPADGSRVSDLFGNQIAAGYAAVAPTDGAAPYPKTATFYDASTNDGKLDVITVVWSENISAVVDASAKWIATSAANFAAVTEGVVECNSAGAGANECDYNFTTTTVKTSVGDLTLAYTASGDQVTDGTNPVANNLSFTSAAGTYNPAFTDGAKPILTAVVAGTSSGANTIAFTYSELMTSCDGASTTTCGNLTTAGTFVGMGTFGTGGNIVVPTLKNTVSGNGTATLTVTLAGQSGGYMASADVAALTVPLGTVTVTAAAGVYDLVSAANTVNPNGAAVTASPLPAAQWDITKPTVTVATFSDTYYNNAAFIAGGTFNTGSDGKADTVTLTASETLKTIIDATATRNDWATSTGATNAYGTSWTIINGAASGTTYTINFSGANTYYDPGTFEVINVQDTVPSFVDRAGNPLASGLTAQTYKLCYTGYSCASGTIANSAIITNSMTQPGQEGGGTDTTPPSVPTGLTAVVNDSKQVVLTWTDPTASDLSNVRVYRIKNEEAAVSLSIVGKGAKTYTDSAVADGDIVKYAISSLDLTGNESSKSSYIQVTITPGATGEEVEETTTETEEEETGEEDTSGEESDITTDTGETITLTDIANHWAKDDITAMVEKGIVTGNPDGSFDPDGNLNRASAAALLFRVLGMEEPTEMPLLKPFTDVLVDAWYAAYVDQLKTLELVNGNPDGTFSPGKSINRAEFLTMAMNTFYYLSDADTQAEIDALKAGAKTTAYADLKTDWYTPIVTAATAKGFVHGSDCGTATCFNATSTITRAEATTILYNMFFTML